jgi:hypothetical protein
VSVRAVTWCVWAGGVGGGCARVCARACVRCAYVCVCIYICIERERSETPGKF